MKSIQISDHSSDLYLDISEADTELNRPPGSKLVQVKMQNNEAGFQGECDLIVDAPEWKAFTEDIRNLYNTLNGDASFSDDCSSIEFLATNHLGAVGVKGTLSTGLISLQFEPIGIESNEFEAIVKKLETA